MSAVRLARGFTGRDAIIKFEGCCHRPRRQPAGEAGSGLLATRRPAGVPEDFAKHTVVLDWQPGPGRNLPGPGQRIACVIIRPIAGNMELRRSPSAHFMHLLRRLYTEHGAVLIFDEVMTSFRVRPRGDTGPVRHHAGSHHLGLG